MRFENTSYQFPEKTGAVELTVLRQNGLSGDIEVYWKTVENTAKPGVDYQGGQGKIVFSDQQV